MSNLTIKRIETPNIDPKFDCGNYSINSKLRQDSYYMDVLQHAYTYEIFYGKILVGYYMISFRTISLNLLPEDLSDYCAGSSNSCTSLHLDFIAIDSKMQKHSIGTNTLRYLIVDVTNNLCRVWPIRLITLEALTNKIDWYKKLGFSLFNEDNTTSNPDSPTAWMYLDCLQDPEKLYNYIESC